MLRKWLVPFITVVSLSTLSCANCPIPWIRAFHPPYLVDNIRRCTTVEANVAVRAKLPYLPLSFATVEFLPDKAIVTIRPPYDTDEVQRIYREELEKRGYAVSFQPQKKE